MSIRNFEPRGANFQRCDKNTQTNDTRQTGVRYRHMQYLNVLSKQYGKLHFFQIPLMWKATQNWWFQRNVNLLRHATSFLQHNFPNNFTQLKFILPQTYLPTETYHLITKLYYKVTCVHIWELPNNYKYTYLKTIRTPATNKKKNLCGFYKLIKLQLSTSECTVLHKLF
jgi:hypothetical protein